MKLILLFHSTDSRAITSTRHGLRPHVASLVWYFLSYKASNAILFALC